MKSTIKTAIGEFTISATYKGDKKAPWAHGQENWNNHLVSVSHKGKRTSFEFWASIASPEIRKPSELKDAFSCFVSDAIGAKDTFENFCSEFGYDTDSREAERIYKACAKSLAKLERLTAVRL